ncbi:MAG: 23S rRNA (guanosine(2251)-2'-O)-methyltransferase RlmB [Bacteroidetes bacterium]|nr:MAG: 23S rRNA (guanosine(2251)-2'-O)-methyltransferase RlmB [Bacteroidota bacterium]
MQQPYKKNNDRFKPQRKPSLQPKEQHAIYGIHAIMEAISAGQDLNKIIVQKGEASTLLQQLLKQARDLNIPLQYVPKESNLFPASKNHQGVLAHISPISYHKLENIIPQIFEKGEVPFVLVLDRITDVRNFGAIARSAYCAGVHALVIPDSGSAQITDDAIKTSAGALHHIPVCREKNMKTTMELLNQSGLVTVGCSEKGKQLLHQLDLTVPVAIIMGNEETGIAEDIIKRCTHLAKIPLELGVQSLNVSVAAGIAAYETIRQRIA